VMHVERDKPEFQTWNTTNGLSDNLILSLWLDAKANELVMGMQNGSVSFWHTQNGSIRTHQPFTSEQGAVVEVLSFDESILLQNESGNIAFLPQGQTNGAFSIDARVDTPDPDSHALITIEGKMIRVGARKTPEILSLNTVQWNAESPMNINCIHVDGEGYLWTANNDGLYRQSKTNLNEKPKLIFRFPNRQFKIVSMCSGLMGDMWFGTYGSGLGRVDGQTLRTTLFTEREGLINDNVLSIAIQSTDMWLATLGGACSFSLIDEVPQFKSYIGEAELGTNFIYQVVADATGRIYFATDGMSVVVKDNNQFFPLKDAMPELGKTVTQIAVDRHGNLLCQSIDKGLQWTNKTRVIDISLDQKLGASSDVLNLAMSRMGDFLIATSSGFYTLDSDLLTISPLSAGLDLKADYLNVLSRDADGIVWFANSSAILAIREPSKQYLRQPRVYLDQVDVLLEPIDTNVHVFASDENHFTFHFGAIRMTDAESTVFQYQLEGFDEGWNSTLDGNVRYPHLRPGKYKFRIRCSRYENWDSASEVVYSFQIQSPLWQRWWFIVGVMTLLMAGVYLIVRIRFNALKRREMIARTAAQSKFETLRNQVNPHFLFNSFNTLNAIIQTEPDEAVRYVERLSDYFRLVLEQREKEVIPLREEIDLVETYLLLQKTRFGDNLNIAIRVDEPTLNYSIPPLTLQLLAENAIKHNIISKSKPLEIIIERRVQSLVVSNNLQPKINKEPSTGIGLDNVRQRYRILYNVEITIEKSDEAFTVYLPLAIK
ncbi:MAG: histidine kinase, partial [Flavobacteriales bacterium]